LQHFRASLARSTGLFSRQNSILDFMDSN